MTTPYERWKAEVERILTVDDDLLESAFLYGTFIADVIDRIAAKVRAET